MGNPKEWEAGEMSGEKLRNHSFQEKRSGSRCKVRGAGAEVWSPPPPFLKEACTLFSRMCQSFSLMCLYVIFACLRCFSFLLFCF